MKPDKRAPSESRESLTVSSAAKIAGKSVSTIRRWIDDGFLPAQKTPEGWRMVEHRDLMAALSRVQLETPAVPSPLRAGATASPAADSPVVRLMEDALKRERESLEHERRISAEIREQNRHLQSELLKLTKEMQAILSKDTGSVLSRWIRSK